MNERGTRSPAVSPWSTALETAICASGRVPESPDHDTAIYLARTRCNDPRKAEALGYLQSTDPLQTIRTFLARGLISDAQSELCGLDPDSEEVLLEKARLAAFEGDWENALHKSNRALSMSPAAITRMTLLQVRSVALFELGEFNGSLRDIEAIVSMRTLFPHALTGFYAEVLRVRNLARLDGVATARARLDRLWTGFKETNEGALDSLLALLRLEIDLNRLAAAPTLALAIATYILADRLGDAQYAALAKLDAYYSLARESRHLLEHERSKAVQEFTRARVLHQEVNDGTGGSETAMTIRQALSNVRSIEELNPIHQEALNLPEAIQSFLFSRRGWVIRLKPFKLTEPALHAQTRAAVEILSRGPTPKSALMKQAWNLKYVSNLHDGVIRTTLSRLRKQTGAQIGSHTGLVRMRNILVIES